MNTRTGDGDLSVNRVGDSTAEGMNGEAPPAPSATNDPLDIVAEGWIVQYPAGEADVSREGSRKGEVQLRRMHLQLKDRFALGHVELPQLCRRTDLNEYIVPKSKRGRNEVISNRSFPCSYARISFLCRTSVWDRGQVRTGNGGPYTVCPGSLLFLVQRYTIFRTSSVVPSGGGKR
jgi:hypothetical protein